MDYDENAILPHFPMPSGGVVHRCRLGENGRKLLVGGELATVVNSLRRHPSVFLHHSVFIKLLTVPLVFPTSMRGLPERGSGWPGIADICISTRTTCGIVVAESTGTASRGG